MCMLSALGWAALGTGFTFGMTTLGAAMVFFLGDAPNIRFQRAVLGFAAGVMTAASVWSLLLPALEQAEGMGLPGWLPAGLGMVAGTVFLAGLDSLLPRLRGERPAEHDRQDSLLMTAIVGITEQVIFICLG